MTYSFNKSISTKWKVSTEVREASVKDDAGNDLFQPFKYHVAFLPHKEIRGVEGHISSYADVNGLLQHWCVLISKEAQVPVIWVLDAAGKDILNSIPLTEELLSSNIGVLQPAADLTMFDDFPSLESIRLYSMVPVTPGICYNTGQWRDENAGFWLIFRSDIAESINLHVTLRHQVFIQNN